MNTSVEDHNSGFRKIEIFLLLSLFSVPILRSIINDAWVFDIVGQLDSWYYYGYGHHYDDRTFLDQYYKISRLPWILIKFAFYKFFDVTTGSYAIQYVMLGGAASFMYMAFRRTVGAAAAFAGAMFFLAYPYSYSSGGASYHNTCAGFFLCLSLYCAVEAAERKRNALWLITAGAAMALTVHSIVVAINMLLMPVSIYVLHFRNRHQAWPPVWRSLLLPALGGLAVTGLLCLANASVGRNPWFFMLQFDLAARFVSDNSNQKSWWHSWSSLWFLSKATLYLWPLLAGAVAGVFGAIIAGYRRDMEGSRRSMVVLHMLGLTFYALLWVFWQSIGQTALDWDYFAYHLVFPLAASVAGFAGMVNGKPLERPSSVVFFAIFTPLIVVLPLLLNPYAYVPKTVPVLISAIMGLSLATLFLLALSGRVLVRMAAFVVLSVTAVVDGSYLLGATALTSCHVARVGMQSIDEAHQTLTATGYPYDKVLIFGEQADKVSVENGCTPAEGLLSMGDFYASLVSTGFNYLAGPWDATRIEDIPEKFLRAAVGDDKLIVLVTTDTGRMDALVRRFAEVGLSVAPNSQSVVSLKTIPAKLVMFRVVPRP